MRIAAVTRCAKNAGRPAFGMCRRMRCAYSGSIDTGEWIHEKDVIEMARRNDRAPGKQLRRRGDVQKQAIPVDADSDVAAARMRPVSRLRLQVQALR
jgi:hypothetical protein